MKSAFSSPSTVDLRIEGTDPNNECPNPANPLLIHVIGFPIENEPNKYFLKIESAGVTVSFLTPSIVRMPWGQCFYFTFPQTEILLS